MSNEIKHTPGPWYEIQYKRSLAFRVTADPSDVSKDICNVIASGGLSENEIAANAKLIAAAPELLEAVALLLADVECYCLDRAEQMTKGVCAACVAKSALTKATT